MYRKKGKNENKPLEGNAGRNERKRGNIRGVLYQRGSRGTYPRELKLRR
jgi:hypothetical protein